MDLRSDGPIWPLRDGEIAAYPSLSRDEKCDVAVIGAGISGALVAYLLAKQGVGVVVVDKRQAAHGSTAASTALLLYDVDTPLLELAKMHGLRSAERAYQLCDETNRMFGPLTRELGVDCGYEPKRSLYLASSARDVPELRRECEARQRVGLRVDFLEKSDIESRFSFSRAGALLSHDAGQIDAYRLTHALLAAAIDLGARVYQKTVIDDYAPGDDRVVMRTEGGPQILARRVVFATGYETQPYLPEKIVDLHSSFAIATQPLPGFDGWEDKCLIWETARPYLYLRTTSDGRAIVGGEDEPFRNPQLRDALIESKAASLHRRFNHLFPRIESRVEYSWAGTFGQTKDGLPYIGQHPAFPLAYFALGYGGNGVTFSLIAAQIICDLFLQRENADAHLFRFDRE